MGAADVNHAAAVSTGAVEPVSLDGVVSDPLVLAVPHAVSVLIVDDSTAFRSIAREVLAQRGYVVAGEADCARSAVELLAHIAPDAALVDIGLPDMQGDKLALHLRGHRPGLVVLLTSVDMHAGREALVERSGAVGFVPKRELATVDLSHFWPRASAPGVAG